MSVVLIERQIRDLRTSGASRFDHVRFAFIRSLSERLATPQHCENQELLNKAQSALDDYQTELKKRQKNASKTLKEIGQRFPAEVKHAQNLFDNYEFRNLEILRLRLDSKHARLDELRELNRVTDSRPDGTEPKSKSFDDILVQQEEQIRIQLGTDGVQTAKPLNQNLNGQIELLSVKLFHESMRHSKIDEIIEKAINTWPENPGPHNPHMLAIKAMVRMRTLSPQYLRRLSVYIETVLFLEKNANRVDDSKSLPQP